LNICVNVEASKYHQIPSIWIEEKIPGTVADKPRDAVATNEGPRRDASQVEQLGAQLMGEMQEDWDRPPGECALYVIYM